MLRKVILLALFLPYSAIGAQIVSFGPKLCGAGKQLSNNECVDIVRGACPDGYYTSTVDSATYSAVSQHVQCMNSYNKVTLPDVFYPIYNGVLVKFGPTLCGADQQLSGDTCVPKVQGSCPDGFYHTVVQQATFSALSVSSGQCMNSYNEYDAPDYFEMIYNGILVPFGPTLCGAGRHLSDGVCVANTRGTCPENYYDVTGDMYNTSKDENGVTTTTKINTMLPLENGACPTGYQVYAFDQNCTPDFTGMMCAVLCDAGLEYTGAGTCAELCAGGVTHMHTSTGWSVPVYATPQISPSLHVLTPAGDMCYVNIAPGAGTRTVNIKRADKTYHITD